MGKKNLNGEVVRFAGVGVINTIIDFVLYNILINILLFLPHWASIFSATIAMTNSFLLNKSWTFKSKERLGLSQVLKFLGFTLFGIFIIQSFFIILLTEYWPVPGNTAYYLLTLLNLNHFLSYDFINQNLAKVIGVSFALIWNFYTYKKWVFKK